MTMLLLMCWLAEVALVEALNMTHLFSDNMVLDFREPAVHGYAKPGATVTASFNGATAHATASAADGSWRVVLGASACEGMPRNAVLSVSEEAGSTVSAKNVACGQVFVCTGQSSA
jgi:hypothetical protein